MNWSDRRAATPIRVTHVILKNAIAGVCTRQPASLAGTCDCPECRDEWARELAHAQTRLRQQCERRCLVLQSEGVNAVPGPFNLPMIVHPRPE